MPTITITVAASADDGRQQSIANDSARAFTSSGGCSITETILSPGSHGSNDEWTVGARFLNVTVPQGATINSATFSMKAQGTYSAGSNTIAFLVSAQAADNPGAFTTTGGNLNTTARPRTTAVSSSWNQTSVTAGTRYSISVTSVIQEIVNRAGWVSGNAIVMLVDTDTTTTVGEWQDYYAYDDATDRTNNPPQLTIDYTTGGTTFTVIGSTPAVMPVYRRSLSAAMAPLTLGQIHQGATVQQTTTTAVTRIPVRKVSWQVSEPGQYHSSVPAVPTLPAIAPMPPARVAKPQTAQANPAALAVTVTPADTSYTPPPGALRPALRSWQVYEPGAYHTAPRVPDIYVIPPERPRHLSRVQPGPWKAVDTQATVAAPQSLVILPFTMPIPTRKWQVYEPGAYHTAAPAAAPQTTATQGVVMPKEPAAGWQVIQAAQLHTIDDTLPLRVEAFQRPALVRLQVGAVTRIETIEAVVAPQTTVTQGSVMPIRQRPGNQADLAPRVETITPPVSPQSTVTQGTVIPAQFTTRRQDGAWKSLEQAVAVVPHVPALETPRQFAVPTRIQPVLWQAINGVPIPPTPGLPGHATTGHGGLAGTRDLGTFKPIWMRW